MRILLQKSGGRGFPGVVNYVALLRPQLFRNDVALLRPAFSQGGLYGWPPTWMETAADSEGECRRLRSSVPPTQKHTAADSDGNCRRLTTEMPPTQKEDAADSEAHSRRLRW